MMLSKPNDMGLAAFAPAEGSKSIQTPYGSLQLAGHNIQQNFTNTPTLGGTLVPSVDSEEDDDDDDEDEDGHKKRKRRGPGSSGSGGSKNGSASGGSKQGLGGAKMSAGGPTAAGERDIHTGRRKIRIEFIEDDSRRHITFSKRKAGIMKKAYELATLTGTQVLLLIVSQTGLVYTFTTPKLSPVVQQAAGRELIQSCLSAPEPGEAGELGLEGLGDEADNDHVHALGPRSDQANSDSKAHAQHPHHMALQQQQHQQQQHQQQHMQSALGHQQQASYPLMSRGNNNNDSEAYAAAFADPRHAALMSMSNLHPGAVGLSNLPAHLQNFGTYGYNNMAGGAGGNGAMGGGAPQLVGHEHGIPYGAYGGM